MSEGLDEIDDSDEGTDLNDDHITRSPLLCFKIAVLGPPSKIAVNLLSEFDKTFQVLDAVQENFWNQV